MYEKVEFGFTQLATPVMRPVKPTRLGTKNPARTRGKLSAEQSTYLLLKIKCNDHPPSDPKHLSSKFHFVNNEGNKFHLCSKRTILSILANFYIKVSY